MSSFLRQRIAPPVLLFSCRMILTRTNAHFWIPPFDERPSRYAIKEGLEQYFCWCIFIPSQWRVIGTLMNKKAARMGSFFIIRTRFWLFLFLFLDLGSINDLLRNVGRSLFITLKGQLETALCLGHRAQVGGILAHLSLRYFCHDFL